MVLPGGLGTLHETIEAHIMQEIGEMKKVLVLVGSYTHNYKAILDFIEKHGLLRSKLETNIRYAKDGEEAVKFIEETVAAMKSDNYFSSAYYPALTPEEIHNHIRQNQNPYYTLIEGIKMKVLPNVYPSNRFRSSMLLARKAKEMSAGKRVADIACGHGTMGIIAAMNGAQHVVQVDINSQAVRNAKDNAKDLDIEAITDIYQGDAFEPLSYKYRNYFDIISFNPPFHLSVDIDFGELVYAFSTQGKEGGVLNKFLRYAKRYLAEDGKIVLAFSNKDPKAVEYLEELLNKYGYDFSLEIVNQYSVADNRFYHITARKEASNASEEGLIGRKVRLGVILADSGVAVHDGRIMRKGVELAVRDLAQEGITVEVGYHDDQSSSSKVLDGLSQLLETFKPQAIVGPTWSYIIEGVAPALEEEKIPYFTPATSSDSLVVRTQNRLSGAYSNDTKQEVLSDWFKENACKRIAVISGDNVWGTEHQTIVSSAAESVGGSIVYSKISPRGAGTAVLSAIVDEVSVSCPDVLIVDNYDDSFFDLIRFLKERGVQVPVIGTVQLGTELLSQIQSIGAGSDLYLLESAVPADFVEKFKDAYGSAPHRYAFNAYMGTLVLVQGLLQKPVEKSLKQFVVEDMRPDIYGEKFSFNEKGDLRTSAWVINPVEV